MSEFKATPLGDIGWDELSTFADAKQPMTHRDWQVDNDNRARRGAVALIAYAQRFDQGEEFETTLSDLLGDLMHLADALKDTDFYYALDRAYRDYTEEIKGE